MRPSPSIELQQLRPTNLLPLTSSPGTTEHENDKASNLSNVSAHLQTGTSDERQDMAHQFDASVLHLHTPHQTTSNTIYNNASASSSSRNSDTLTAPPCVIAKPLHTCTHDNQASSRNPPLPANEGDSRSVMDENIGDDSLQEKRLVLWHAPESPIAPSSPISTSVSMTQPMHDWAPPQVYNAELLEAGTNPFIHPNSAVDDITMADNTHLTRPFSTIDPGTAQSSIPQKSYSQTPNHTHSFHGPTPSPDKTPHLTQILRETAEAAGAAAAERVIQQFLKRPGHSAENMQGNYAESEFNGYSDDSNDSPSHRRKSPKKRKRGGPRGIENFLHVRFCIFLKSSFINSL